MKHTPGPWKNNCFLVIAPNGRERSSVYGGQEICHTGGHGTPSEECEANARLIAAAPEMLELLKECRGYVEDYGHVGNLKKIDELLESLEAAE